MICFNANATYLWAVGGSWSSTTSWATSDGGAGGHAIPTSSDNVIFSASSPAMTVNTANAPCYRINFATYTHTLTMSQAIVVSGDSITLGSGMTIAGTNGLAYNGTDGVFASNGKVWPNSFSMSPSSAPTDVIIGGNNWIIGGTVTLNNYAQTINNATTEQLECRGNLAISSTYLLTGTAGVLFSGSGTEVVTGNIGCNVNVNMSGTLNLGSASLYCYFGNNSTNVTFTYSAGTVYVAGATYFAVDQNATFNTGSRCVFGYMRLTPSSSCTITLNNILYVTNLVLAASLNSSYNLTWAGSYGWVIGNISNAASTNYLSNIILTYGNTYTITTSWVDKMRSDLYSTWKSSSAGNAVTLHLTNPSSCNLGYTSFTDVNAACSTCRSIATFEGVLSNTTNIFTNNDLTTQSY